MKRVGCVLEQEGNSTAPWGEGLLQLKPTGPQPWPVAFRACKHSVFGILPKGCSADSGLSSSASFILPFISYCVPFPPPNQCVCVGGGRKSLLKLCKQRGGCFASGCKTHLLQKCKERHNDGVPSWKSRPFPGEKQSTEMKSSSRPSLT